MIMKVTKTIGKSILLAAIIVCSYNSVVAPTYSAVIAEDTPIIKEYAPYLRALKDVTGRNYCSSSSVNYKDDVYTITNNHCCDYGLTLFGNDEIRVGDTIEKVLVQSEIHDVCILTSSQKDTPIKVATKPVKMLDKVLLMGYPRGTFLTPRFGHVVSLYEDICLYDGPEKECRKSHVISAISYQGNSGSPVFNSKGELVNLLYAGNSMIVTMGITVPLVFIRQALGELN